MNKPVAMMRTRLKATCPMTKACRRRRRPTRGASFLRPGRTSAFDAATAGASPDSKAATSESPAVKASTRPSSVSDRDTGNGSVGSRETNTDVRPRASRRPIVPPSANSSIVSVSSCRMRRARPAPIARRSAISCRRAVARESRTPATLAHAMINTIDTIAIMQREECDDRSGISRNGRRRPAPVTPPR